MYRILLSLFAALVAAACSPLQARPLVEMTVIDRDDGQWLEPSRYRGQDWIAGKPGHRYSVRLTNTTGRRVLVVLSVDGVNAVTGETAHPSQTGYVLGPWQTSEIHGWRKSLDDVAQFVFTDLPDSYAARTGRPDNVGVIGIAVFAEARRWYHDTPIPIARGERERNDAAKSAAPAAESRAAEAASSGSRAAEPAAQSIGTGHGAREWSQATRTGFDRETRHPVQVNELRYDDAATLVARGVPIRQSWPYGRHHWRDAPRAFPDGFVADPPRRY